MPPSTFKLQRYVWPDRAAGSVWASAPRGGDLRVPAPEGTGSDVIIMVIKDAITSAENVIRLRTKFLSLDELDGTLLIKVKPVIASPCDDLNVSI